MSMNIYISGPIEGVDNYREKFERAKRIYASGTQARIGYHVMTVLRAQPAR